MDDMNAEMRQAEKHITGMEKWCGLCVCPWNRCTFVLPLDVSFVGVFSFIYACLPFLLSPSSHDKKRSRKISDRDATWKKPADNGRPNPIKNPPGTSANVGQVDGPYIKRINNDAREDEMEENMQAVGNILGNLRNMAQDMGNEIEAQNQQIDRITAKVPRTLPLVLCSLRCFG